MQDHFQLDVSSYYILAAPEYMWSFAQHQGCQHTAQQPQLAHHIRRMGFSAARGALHNATGPYLVVPHNIRVLQPAECGHLPQDAAVAAAATAWLQPDLLHSILAAIKPAGSHVMSCRVYRVMCQQQWKDVNNTLSEAGGSTKASPVLSHVWNTRHGTAVTRSSC